MRRALTAEKLRLQSATPQTTPFIQATIDHLESQLKEIAKAVGALLKAGPDGTLNQRRLLLQSIPGIGSATALTLLAELPDPALLNERARCRRLGRTHPLCESGTSVHQRARLSKQRNGRLRKALYMPALVLLRGKAAHGLGRLRDRLREAGKPEMVIIGALMRKLLQTACGVLKHRQPFNPSLS